MNGVETFVDTAEEENEWGDAAHFPKNREIDDMSWWTRIPPRDDLAVRIREEFSAISKGFVKWWQLMTIILALIALIVQSNSRFNQVDESVSKLNIQNDRLGGSVDELNSSIEKMTKHLDQAIVLLSANNGQDYVQKYMAGKRLTDKGRTLLQKKLPLIEEILQDIYKQEPTALPSYAPILVYEFLENSEKRGIDDLKQMIAKQNINHATLTSIIMARAFEIRQTLVAKNKSKPSGKKDTSIANK